MIRNSQIRDLRRAVYGYYRVHRRKLPWRRTSDPYRILVSEVMLQQTQVPRVVEKYPVFIRAFKDIRSLAQAPLAEILKYWQGLGYNRRARDLKEMSRQLLARHEGRVPQTVEELDALPGVGRATAAAVCAYAFNKPVVFIETNIRSVFIHHFFNEHERVDDRTLAPYIEDALDRRNPRRWYSALMDYGVHLKRLHSNPGRRSAHYKKQGAFAGSDRQVRGQIVRLLLDRKKVSSGAVKRRLGIEPLRFEAIVTGMARDGLIEQKGQCLSLGQ